MKIRNRADRDEHRDCYQFLAQGSAAGARGEDDAEEELILSLGLRMEGEQYMNGQREGKGRWVQWRR